MLPATVQDASMLRDTRDYLQRFETELPKTATPPH